MESKSDVVDIELICVITNFGMGSKILKTAKSCGVHGGTITLARGTANNRILDYLGLSDVRKEILYMATEKDVADRVLDRVNQEFKLYKPNHGIAFTTTICKTAGLRISKCDNEERERGENNTMYQVITIIVEKGKAEDVIEAAMKAGSKGGTIVCGRGSGLHETSKLFSMDIEPEKEIVIILSEVEMTDAITTAIRNDLKIDEPGKGIIYVQDVNQTYGIYK
jgi:nitrogen regulatory protein PII